ncbi:MAG TPA: porin family protein [Balneolaceae bacterium]|nr:porin family protein [Balneolaceae bacterium]
MKKSLFIFSMILAFGIFTNKATAQSHGGFGIRGGVNFSQLNNTNANDNSRTGLLLGLYFDESIVDNLLMVQPEVLYTQKGFKSGGYNYRIDYIEVPIDFRVNFVNPSGVLPFVYAGPYVGFKVNTKFPGSSATVNGTTISYNNGNNVKGTDFGIGVGGGLDFGRVNIGVRYDAGLTHVFNNGSAKNGVFSIVAGIGY